MTIDTSFADSVALVTGASRGLGREIALRFGRAGVKVIATARDLGSLSELKLELGETGTPFLLQTLDVRSYASWELVMERCLASFGGLDYLINNASGYLTGSDLREMTVEEVDSEIETTYRGVVYGTKAALPQMIQKRRGTVINISSVSGLMHNDCDSALYAADKAAVIRFSEVMHAFTAQHEVRVLCVVPPAIRSDELAENNAVSFGDVASTVLAQCSYRDNLAMQTVILSPAAVRTAEG